MVHWLTEELIALGNDVTLFASGDSQTSAKLDAREPAKKRPQDGGALGPSVLRLRRAADRSFQSLTPGSLTTYPVGYTEFGDPVLTLTVGQQVGEALIGSVGAQFRFPLMGWSGRAHAHQQASLQGALKTRSTPWQKLSRIQSPSSASASARSIGEQPMSDVGKAVTKHEFNDAVCR